MKYFEFFFSLIFMISICSCKNSHDADLQNNLNNGSEIPITFPNFFYGADLSYVNEMEDCGAIYFDNDNIEKDVYEILANKGANIARYRLWHDPKWTNYSNLSDVKKSIRRAKENGMYVLLDFHYSDTWADPGQQTIPAAWLPFVNNVFRLASELYDYTYDVLIELYYLQLTPDIVQLGNEINPMILQEGELVWPIDWTRNALLLNSAIQAVEDFSSQTNKKVETMLHIAQPENALWWFEQATKAGVRDYQWIGISYYPQWSEYSVSNIQQPLKNLIENYNKKLMIVETAYPFTLDYVDSQNNILGTSAILDEYPATQEGQLNYLTSLSEEVKKSGGLGIVYWEPAWISTDCNSAWENATLFDFSGIPTLGIQFFSQD